jgi:SpoVK/Ycf46/Vps4 family AAA+-type ATPase
MARADLLIDLIKNSLRNNVQAIRKAAEAIAAEERLNHHGVLAQKIDDILKSTCLAPETVKENQDVRSFLSNKNIPNFYIEKTPEKFIEQLILSDSTIKLCNELVEEQMRADLLRSYGVEPRNKILLIGPPGNGKTSLAEAMASALMTTLYTVRYESIVGSYLGETASRLAKLFDFVRTRQCVLFFDEFETLGKERGDEHETGEIKRVVSSLLLQIDALPSYVVFIAATNHDNLLDSAVWRRFQLKLELPKPNINELELWLSRFEKRNKFKFDVGINFMAQTLNGKSYAEAEEFAISVYRQYILHQPNADMKDITENQLKLFFPGETPKNGTEGVSNA